MVPKISVQRRHRVFHYAMTMEFSAAAAATPKARAKPTTLFRSVVVVAAAVMTLRSLHRNNNTTFRSLSREKALSERELTNTPCHNNVGYREAAAAATACVYTEHIHTRIILCLCPQQQQQQQLNRHSPTHAVIAA